VASLALVPLIKSKTFEPNVSDIVDEAIALFRPNCFFKHFEIRGPADLTLAYLLLFISECLGKFHKEMTASDGLKVSTTIASQTFVLPGNAEFPLNALFPKPAGRSEAEQVQKYLLQARTKVAQRLVSVVFCEKGGKASKWWLSFQKRKFMNKSL